MPVDLEKLLGVIKDDRALRAAPFETLRDVARLLSSRLVGDSILPQVPDRDSQEVLLRCLEKRALFRGYETILDDLVRSAGLFPYLKSESRTFSDEIAIEYHRPLNLEQEKVIFHAPQARVYRELLAGRSVVLSAPTSFGKSLIVDAIIASGRHRNIVIIVPTIALMDETRRRLSRFSPSYKIVTHVSQTLVERNVFILTQERVLEFPDISVDFFIIDEFYKLSPQQENEDRAYLLNQALSKLLKKTRQFYLLGPSIDRIPPDFADQFGCTFFKTDYATVVTEQQRITVPAKAEFRELVKLCRTLDEPTIIFCRSKERTRDVAEALLNAELTEEQPQLQAAANWMAQHYHATWIIARALRSGVGIHHGSIPRALGHFMVRAFNDGRIRFLVCTSTLIEGVNTKAKNVVVFDNKIAREKFDYFTFNNIRGRSGRMREHFVGRVFIFHQPPIDTLPAVDIPLVTQPADAPGSFLIQLDDAQLSDASRKRLEPYLNQTSLSLDAMRANVGFDPAQQISLADAIRTNAASLSNTLCWTFRPTKNQLYGTCDLLWAHLKPTGKAGVFSARQLAFKLDRMRAVGGLHELIAALLKKPEKGPDEDVEEALDFARLWCQHHFPRMLRVLNIIQKEVLGKAGIRAGEYSNFAREAENLFLPSNLVMLDEYGIPIPVAQKLGRVLPVDRSLDSMLQALKDLDTRRMKLGEFELEVIADAQRGL